MRTSERAFPMALVWGEKVAARRDILGLSQAELAELCNVTQQTISKIENGTIVPRDTLKLVLAEKLRSQPESLFPWPPPEKGAA